MTLPQCCRSAGGHRRRSTFVLAVPAVLLVTVSGCGSDTSGSTPAPTATVTATATATATATVTASPSTGPSACTSASLRVGMSRGEGAAGSVYYVVRLTNTSAGPCRTGGFGGVSLVHAATGDPVGAPADRVARASAKRLTLPPGGAATATLQLSQAGDYPAASCHPTPTAGFRIYPPDQTRSSFVARPTTGCRSATVHLLRLMPYRRAG